MVCCTTDQIEGTLSSLAAPPKLIITDSQVFSTVYAQKPAASLLTSFSVLFARYKGDIDYFVESAAAIGQLLYGLRNEIADVTAALSNFYAECGSFGFEIQKCTLSV